MLQLQKPEHHNGDPAQQKKKKKKKYQKDLNSNPNNPALAYNLDKLLKQRALALCLLFGKMRITIPILWMLLKNWINTCKLYVCVLSGHSVVSDFLQPMDCSPPGSSVYGILQARKLKWVATSSSRRSSRPRDWIHVSFTGRWALHCWATREARILHHCAVMMSPGQLGEKEKSRGFVPKWKLYQSAKFIEDLLWPSKLGCCGIF